MFTDGNIFMLIKEPYELTLKEFISKHSQEYVQISWEFITRSIEESLVKTISSMKKQNLHLNRMISTEDLVHVLGEWKLHSPDMFELGEGGIEASQALSCLREQIESGLAKSNHFRV